MLVSRRTAEQLKQLIAKKDSIRAKPPRPPRGDRETVLVRCTSSVAAEISGLGAQCYPGVIVDPKSTETVQPELGSVWLTVLGDNGSPVRPQANRLYPCVLSGSAEASDGDSRPRAFSTPNCCHQSSGGGGGGAGPSGTFAIACDDSGGSEASESYTVVMDCAQIDGLLTEEVCFLYAPTADVEAEVCTTSLDVFTLLCGTAALRFLATAAIDSIHFCCPETLEAEIPQIACIQLLNGRRAYASIASAVSLQSEFSGFAYPIDYTTPNGKVKVNGKLVFCRNHATPGWYFAGSIISTDKDSNNPDVFGCGCDTLFGGCADSSGITQQITVGPNFSVPSQTLKLTSRCGTLEIKLAGPYPCSPPPPPATFNCISGRCVDPKDGTGVFSSYSACLASGCQSQTFNCISGRCVDPSDGTGTFTSLDDCLDSPCEPLVSFNCVPGSAGGPCIDPGDGTGTFTSLELCEASGCGGLCYGDYLRGKTGTLVITGGDYDGQTWDVVFATSPPPVNTNAWGAQGVYTVDDTVLCRERPGLHGGLYDPPGRFWLQNNEIFPPGGYSVDGYHTSLTFGGGPGPLTIKFNRPEFLDEFGNATDITLVV